VKANPEMDAAAEAATKELDKLDQQAVQQVADWWKANYLKAGHKRLARKLLERATSPVSELKELVS